MQATACLQNEQISVVGIKSDTEILDAALVVFQKEGFAGATTRKIAEQAGVNEVTLFRKFKTKENLFQLTAQRIGTQTLAMVDEIFTRDPSASLEAQLHEVFKRLQRFLDEHIPVILLLLNESNRGFPDISQALLQIPRMLMDRLKEIFESKLDHEGESTASPDFLSFAFLGFTFYYTLMNNLSKGSIMEGKVQEFPVDYIHLILGDTTGRVSKTDTNES
ncbi:MAG TPA: TetR/AcrR family transcriptional regulator [Candidatus Lokiarchaeia archaeon]|nr:TetR/AcrR family transcriptional regulator [Candidatus Lokiarchaeia archaeon]